MLTPPTELERLTNAGYELLDPVRSAPWSILLAGLALGILAMTLVEGVKPRLRFLVYEFSLYRWLNLSGIEISNNLSLRDLARYFWTHKIQRKTIPRFEQFEELVILSMGGNKRALLKLPIENFCGQLIVGLQTAIEAPQKYRRLIEIAMDAPLWGEQGKADLDVLEELVMAQRNKHAYADREPDNDAAQQRILNHMQRRIDSLQVDLGEKWNKVLFNTAFLISLLIMGIVTVDHTRVAPFSFMYLLVCPIIAYEGAFFARLIKNILNRIERPR